MKTIVTHRSVDLDSITSCWLIKRFLPDWKDAQIEFVSAGNTFKDLPPDKDPEIIHVDTGLGKFDHHQTQEHTSASKKVYEYLVSNYHIPVKIQNAAERLVRISNDLDHFGEAYYPEADSDRYDFMLHQIIEGLKGPLGNDLKITETVFILLDGILQVLRNKTNAENAIKEGFVFTSNIYGKCIVMQSPNEEAIKLALKTGFSLAAKKDPVKGNIRIKTLPKKEFDLTKIYEKIKQKDKKGTWFLHISKNMLLNSSSKNPNFVPSALTAKQLIEIIKKI